jgi:transglutaminase-like putative cysteine protease
MRFVLRWAVASVAAAVWLTTFSPPVHAQADPPKPTVPDPKVQKAEEDAKALVTAFLTDLSKGEHETAVKRLAKPMFPFGSAADARLYWDELTGWHGKFKTLGEVTAATTEAGTVATARVKFERWEYLFTAKLDDGKLAAPALRPVPLGGHGVLRASHGCVVGPSPKSDAPGAIRRGRGVVTFAVPGTYRDQVPLSFEVKAEPAKAMKGYKLRQREDGLNWVCDVFVDADGPVTVWWEATVLVSDRKPATLPKAATPEVTPAVERWVKPTGCVQSDDSGVKKRADELAKDTTDVGEYAKKVTDWVAKNRGTGQPFGSLDAAAALGCGGSCTSRANLSAALLRARGIPARTVAHLPTWAGPLYVHWLTEYWHPNHGWVTIEPSRNQNQPSPSTYAVINVATPDDEDHAIFASLRSGVMAGAPRFSSRDIDGGLVPAVEDNWAKFDTRTIGLAVPLAKLQATDAEWKALTTTATGAHAKLTVEGRAGAIKADRRTAVWEVLTETGVSPKKLTDVLTARAK